MDEALVFIDPRVGEVVAEACVRRNGAAVEETSSTRVNVRNGVERLIIVRPDYDRSGLDFGVDVLEVHDAEFFDYRAGRESGDWCRRNSCWRGSR